MARTRVKICGITSSQDAQAATQAGVDAIGLVFYPPSSRFVSIQQAQGIVNVLPPFVSVVALFVNADNNQVEQVLDHLPIDCLQFHLVHDFLQLTLKFSGAFFASAGMPC